ncbi:MAG: hypothetical protein V1739_05390 [Candidatus Omnitrophota bacterium]
MLCWSKKKELFEYAIGELNADRVQKIEKHLKSCSKCRKYVSGVQKINSISACDEQLFLNEVFWRKFDERLDLNLAQAQRSPAKHGVSNIRFLPKPLPRFAFSAAVAICVFLVFIASLLNNPLRSRITNLQDEELIETALLIEDESELNLNGDEDAYIEEILLQIALEEA